MPKAEAGTPKAIGKAIKAKGLQKLKFFCQVCQKQCRDDNGFKCHITSEAHQRQMLIVAENPNQFLEDYSKQFLSDFMRLFRTRYGSKRVFANQIYQEYIKDKQHVHMNSTRWFTLGSFVAWLGKCGYAEVDHTERGWYMTYIDRDPETLKRQELSRKKDKMEKDYDERMREIINEQIERGKQTTRVIEDEKEEDKLLRREHENEKIILKLDLNKKSNKNNKELSKDKRPNAEEDKEEHKEPKEDNLNNKQIKTIFEQPKISSKRQKEIKRSALDDIIEEEESKKKRIKKDNWIEKNLIVKVITKKVPEKYQNKKGVIEKIEDRFLAYVRMNESNALIKVDQKDLETVIPKEGNLIKLVNGYYQSDIAKLIKVDQTKINATVKIEKGLNMGKQFDVEFEDICKFAS